MGADDWFRNSVWTPAIQEAFFKRLARSRSARNKAEYLRIQAGHLQEQHDAGLVRVALSLLDLMLAQCPELCEVAPARLQEARCHLFLGDHGRAGRLPTRP